MKKVLLVVIDALASRVIVPAIHDGKLPTLARLIEHGTLHPECTSIFPSITPAATATLATGVYPCDHQVAAAFWYDREENSVAYYGDDFWVVVNRGMGQFFDDFLVRLNQDRLQHKTLYQVVEEAGLTAAAINYMWFHGDTSHSINASLLFQLLPGVEVAETVMGPKVLALADFAQSAIPGTDKSFEGNGGITRRYGFDDSVTADYLLQLAAANPLPDFTIAYFPNNDFDSHDIGPNDALATVQAVDTALGEFIDALGGFEKVFPDLSIIVTGDHSQTDVAKADDSHGIDLSEVLSPYQIATPGQPWSDGDEIMVCTNMRSSHLYVKDRMPAMRDRMIEVLLADSRIDQVFWRDSTWETATDPGPVHPRADTFHVLTADRGQLTFRYSHPSERVRGIDAYGNNWTWDGEFSAVDALLNDGQLIYGEYPNALERIATGFSSNSDEVWVTAKPGFEFELKETSIHNGGSHGALNHDDSIVPLIVAGHAASFDLPSPPRTVDVGPLVLRTLGLTEQADSLLANRLAGRSGRSD